MVNLGKVPSDILTQHEISLLVHVKFRLRSCKEQIKALYKRDVNLCEYQNSAEDEEEQKLSIA